MENVNQIDKTEMYEMYCEYTLKPKSYQSITRIKMASAILDYYINNFESVLKNLHHSLLEALVKIYKNEVIKDVTFSDDEYNELVCCLFIVMSYENRGYTVRFRDELKSSFNEYFKSFDFEKQIQMEKAYVITKGLTRALGFVTYEEVRNNIEEHCSLDEDSITELLETYNEEDVLSRRLSFTDDIVVYGLHYNDSPLDFEMITDFELFKGPYKEFTFLELKTFAENGYNIEDESVQELLFTIGEATRNHLDYIIFDIFMSMHNTCQKSSHLIEMMVPILDRHYLRIGEGYEIIKQMIKFSAIQPKWIYKGFSEYEMLQSVSDSITILPKED